MNLLNKINLFLASRIIQNNHCYEYGLKTNKWDEDRGRQIALCDHCDQRTAKVRELYFKWSEDILTTTQVLMIYSFFFIPSPAAPNWKPSSAVIASKMLFTSDNMTVMSDEY